MATPWWPPFCASTKLRARGLAPHPTRTWEQRQRRPHQHLHTRRHTYLRTRLRVRSSTPYQEGCVQASVDGGPTQWLSSGLEDFFLGSNFHTMPNEELRLSGSQALHDCLSLWHSMTLSLPALRH